MTDIALTREDITDDVMRQYLMTWLVMYGHRWVNTDEAYEVDLAINDDDELCWARARSMKLIGKKDVDDEAIHMMKSQYRLTKKAIKFIGGN